MTELQQGEHVRLRVAPAWEGYVVRVIPSTRAALVVYRNPKTGEVRLKAEVTDGLEGLGEFNVNEMNEWVGELTSASTDDELEASQAVVISRKVCDIMKVAASEQLGSGLEAARRINAMIDGDIQLKPALIERLSNQVGPKIQKIAQSLNGNRFSWNTFVQAARSVLSPQEWAKFLVSAHTEGMEVDEDDNGYIIDVLGSLRKQGASATEALWEVSKPTYGLTSSEAVDFVKRVFRHRGAARIFSAVMRPQDVGHGDVVHYAAEHGDIPWGSLVKVIKVGSSSDCVIVSYKGDEVEVPTRDLMHPRLFAEGQPVRAYVEGEWRDAKVRRRTADHFIVSWDGRAHRVTVACVRYADDSQEDRAIEYGLNLLQRFSLEETMTEIRRRFQLRRPILDRVQQLLSKSAAVPVFGTKVVVREDSRKLNGRILKRGDGADSFVVQFADGQGVVEGSNMDPACGSVSKLGEQADYVLFCDDEDQAKELLNALETRGFSTQFISQRELAASVDADHEEDLYELAYEHIPLERITKQDVDMSIIEAFRPFILSEVGAGSIEFESTKVGDKANRKVMNRWSREVLVPEGARFSEVDLEALRNSSVNGLYRNVEGQLVSFDETPFDHTNDPYLTREVACTLASARISPDGVIALEDGSLFIEQGTVITPGIRVAMGAAGPLAFVESFAEKYADVDFQPELQLSYDINSAMQSKDDLSISANVTFACGQDKHSFSLSNEHTPFFRKGVFDAVAFQVSLLSGMVRSGIDEGAAYRFARTPQYKMLETDVVERAAKAADLGVQIANIDYPEHSEWIASRLVTTLDDLRNVGVDIDNRTAVVNWLHANRGLGGGHGEVLVFLKYASDLEYSRIKIAVFDG